MDEIAWANDGMFIRDWTGEYDFLDNGYPAPVTYDNYSWPTVEHAYQAAKCDDVKYRQRLKGAERAGAARLIGQSCPYRCANWYESRFIIMRSLLLKKFSDKVLQAKLVKTYPRILQYGNAVDDVYGVLYYPEFKAWSGQNELGLILSQIRDLLVPDELRNCYMPEAQE